MQTLLKHFYHSLKIFYFCCGSITHLTIMDSSHRYFAAREAVLSAARIWQSVSRYLEISFGLRGPSPQAFTTFQGLGSSPGAWGAPNKGNIDGAVGIFGNAGRVWAPALRLDPLKKGLVPHLPVRWGEQLIPQINIGVIRTVRDFLPFLCNPIFLV